MTPNPTNTPPVAPSALPLIALIIGVVGFCFPPIFPIAIILAIVSLVKASEPAYAARKTLAIITLVMGLVYVPVVGILAAIAIPNFIRFQARAKQSECKTNLKAMYMGQKSAFMDSDKWGETAEEIGFDPLGGNRYSYQISQDSSVPAKLSTSSDLQLLAAYPADLSEQFGVRGECPDDCQVTMGCAGNIDNDPTIDVWSISTGQRTIEGEVVPAGVPYNHRNDVQD